MTEIPSQSVVIVTALDVETRAVLRQLGPWSEETVEGTVLYVGAFEDWNVAVVEVGPGNISVAALASRAIGYRKADVALFVGVAGGVKDVNLGDVVVASKVYGYESGKDTAAGFLPRPDMQYSAHALEQRGRAIGKRMQWSARLDKSIDHINPQIFVGPIAAGEKVVASTRSATARFLKTQYGDALAVEMEGRGFLQAVHINAVVGTVIRGISDRLDGKSSDDKAGWQRKAADVASAVAFEMLATLSPRSAPDAAQRVISAPMPSAVPDTARVFPEMPSTLNKGAFFKKNEILARVGVRDVDEVLFSFSTAPDSYVRIIPKVAKAVPIANARLNAGACFAPLLKPRQYGCLTSINRLGAIAYDPGGSHRGGPATLSCATQLFPNGELWLCSNATIVRNRGERQTWVPVPFIPALSFEDLFFDKVRSALSFSVQHLSLTFPCTLEMGLIGTEDVYLAVNEENIQPIRKEQVVVRESLASASDTVVNSALLAFFGQIYDATGFARSDSLFGFPPNRPKA